MERKYYLDLAARGLRMPIGTHLILQEAEHPEKILRDGKRLAEVILETADRFQTPLAFPVMDLALEKEILLTAVGIQPAGLAVHQFKELPAKEILDRASRRMNVLAHRRMAANCEALSRVAARDGVLPVGVTIGPFSLLTKLVRDPITPIYLADAGLDSDPPGEAAILEGLLPLAEDAVRASCEAQMQSGAGAILVCEPSANQVFFSPNQIRRAGSRLFTDFVIDPNKRLKTILDSRGCDLILHDCGELIPEMISAFSDLDPAIISLGSPVRLWEAASLLPKTTVLFGNLPTKKFYSEVEMPVEKVKSLTRDIQEKMTASGHPFIIGSECDVLCAPGYEQIIMKKVQAFRDA
jgi:uroporphyrinogen-III decarboxylase